MWEKIQEIRGRYEIPEGLIREELKIEEGIEAIELIIGIILGVAYITLGERKIMGAMQRRVGPDKVGRYGILQPIIDAVKLLIKEILIPKQVNKIIYMTGPIITLILALIIWIPIPIWGYKGILIENEYSIIYILAISSISVYVLLYSGWASNSKYTFIGTVRAIAQLISYEVSIGIIIMGVVILADSLNVMKIEYSQIYVPLIMPLFPIFILFIISAIAETNRPPFDLPEAESELVGGILTEYGGMAFAYLYLAEYTFLLSMSVLTSILFLGTTKLTPLFVFIFIWARTSLPRVRYDQLMGLGWTKILPFSIAYLLFIFSSLIVLNT